MGWVERKRAAVTGVHCEARPGSNGGKARAGRNVRKGDPPEAPRRLPVLDGWASRFRSGEGGERRECGNYDRCLAAYMGNGPAYCPDDCARWEPEADRPRATDYVSENGAARGLLPVE